MTPRDQKEQQQCYRVRGSDPCGRTVQEAGAHGHTTTAVPGKAGDKGKLRACQVRPRWSYRKRTQSTPPRGGRGGDAQGIDPARVPTHAATFHLLSWCGHE